MPIYLIFVRIKNYKMDNYRQLKDSEIKRLEERRCVAEDWSKILVDPEFDTEYVSGVRFSGNVRIGCLKKQFELDGGLKLHSGLRNVTFHNVIVHDNCFIENVQNYIADYEIGSDTFIQNLDILCSHGTSSFGNGVEVAVLNETGGRNVRICDKLSAHMAYITALYRHRPVLSRRLEEIINRYAEHKTSDMGRVGSHVLIVNTGRIENMNIGDYVIIKGASRLTNGTIVSDETSPVTIGHNVIADEFIVENGSIVDSGAQIERCFIGQSCELRHGYTASDSLFFSNCQGMNGEACAIFAGPFTVTHHKSTLLIAGLFSFMNAGSGSNQSNHMYKLGPIHQGMLERGAKTSSDSYILWPSRVGAFSLVMGRHVNHSDTSNLPFSYLIEQNNTTYLVPGVNLKSVGTIRDAKKWPRRDKRPVDGRMDFVNFNLLSPYTIQKMMNGRDLLTGLQKASGMLSDEYAFHSAKIGNRALKKGVKYYTTGIHKFMGNSLIKRLEIIEFKSDREIRERLRPDTETGRGEWVDISGLIAPKSEVNRLIEDIESGVIDTIDDINAAFKVMHDNYYTYEWTWVYDHFEEFYGINPAEITADNIINIVNMWKDAVIGLDKKLYKDAQKEFSLSAKTGFGADGNSEEKELDFEQVRGDFDSNPFVISVLEHIKKKDALGEELKDRMHRCKKYMNK